MERRNNPTPINYIPEANNNIPYAPAIMKALQITQPFQSGALENTMVFNLSTVGYKDIIFSTAVVDEGAATGISIDYSVNAGAPVWITTGMASTSFALTNAYQLMSFDFTSITTANDNANFKVRLRFTGPDMTADTGKRVTFNNIAVHGTAISLGLPRYNTAQFGVYPNPTTDIVNIVGTQNAEYHIFSIDGKMVKSGITRDAKINMSELNSGLYLLQITSEGNTETKKIIKK